MTTKIVSLLALRGLRDELRAIAEKHPRLVDPSMTGPANVEEWEGIQMTETLKAVSYRLPIGLLERLEAYQASVRKRTGVKVSKTDALRIMLELSLDLVDLVEEDPALPADPAVIRELMAMSLEAVQNVREPVA